jgi:hypothetical protein
MLSSPVSFSIRTFWARRRTGNHRVLLIAAATRPRATVGVGPGQDRVNLPVVPVRSPEESLRAAERDNLASD